MNIPQIIIDVSICAGVTVLVLAMIAVARMDGWITALWILMAAIGIALVLTGCDTPRPDFNTIASPSPAPVATADYEVQWAEDRIILVGKKP